MSVYRTSAKVKARLTTKYRVIVAPSYVPYADAEDYSDIVLGHYSYWITAWLASLWYITFNSFSEAIIQKRMVRV